MKKFCTESYNLVDIWTIITYIVYVYIFIMSLIINTLKTMA